MNESHFQNQIIPQEKQRIDNLNNVQEEIEEVFRQQQEYQWVLRNTTYRERKAKLKMLREAILDHQDEIREVVYRDFKKPVAEVDTSEILIVIMEINHAIRNLRKWMKPHPVSNPLLYFGFRSWYKYEPRGTALIISPWNYPFMLALSPIVSAIAAGNTIILKPSEVSSHTSAFLKKFLESLFDRRELAVFEGDYRIAQLLLKQPFNHIYYTGSTRVGKLVMEAASRHLASVTLELGGKNPTIIEKSANVTEAAQKLAWEKCFNGGQTCVAPDYILIDQSIEEEFLSLFIRHIQKYYGQTPPEIKNSPDFARIIDRGHFYRLQGIFEDAIKKGAQLVFGGEMDEDSLYIAPTVLRNVPLDADIMQEEIFGPILPIHTYQTLEEAIEIIRSKPRPLAFYIFSRNRKIIEKVIKEIPSGTVCVNDSLVQFVQNHLPFGGLNDSGFGNAHGFYGFQAFSHQKPILKSPRFSGFNFLYPPYTERVKKLVQLAIRYFV